MVYYSIENGKVNRIQKRKNICTAIRKERDYMDVFKFINSRDIREYLQKINYSFSPLEVAWLVKKSKYTTLKEKHEAWREIIKTMPDCEIGATSYNVFHPSLHEYLRMHMNYENRCVNRIKTEEPYTVYSYKFMLSEEDGWSERNDFDVSELFSDFSTCFTYALDKCRILLGKEDIEECRICIRKCWLDRKGNFIDAEITQSGEIIRVFDASEIFSEELDAIWYGIDVKRMDFPTPFKSGDIICNQSIMPNSFDFECEYGPCVLRKEISDSNCVMSGENSIRGYSSDMIVEGLFQREDGTVFAECTANYMNYEYFRGELTGKKRILKAISNYLKGEISLDLLLNAYHIIIMEEHLKDARPYNITQEGLELAGIPKREVETK